MSLVPIQHTENTSNSLARTFFKYFSCDFVRFKLTYRDAMLRVMITIPVKYLLLLRDFIFSFAVDSMSFIVFNILHCTYNTMCGENTAHYVKQKGMRICREFEYEELTTNQSYHRTQYRRRHKKSILLRDVTR